MNGFREVFNVDSVYKLDIETGNTICRKKEGFVPSEGIFVVRPESKEEDDGILIHQWLSLLPDQKPTLTFLNASDLSMIAELEFPVDYLPVGIHGMVFQLEGETSTPETPSENGAKAFIPSLYILLSTLLLLQ